MDAAIEKARRHLLFAIGAFGLIVLGLVGLAIYKLVLAILILM